MSNWQVIKRPDEEVKPSHWQPLPSPPVAKAEPPSPIEEQPQ